MNQLEPSVPARKRVAAMSAHKHAKLCGLSPSDCGIMPPPPPPAKPSVSSSSETGERNADEDCYGSLSTVITCGGSAAFARVVRNASCGVGSAK